MEDYDSFSSYFESEKVKSWDAHYINYEYLIKEINNLITYIQPIIEIKNNPLPLESKKTKSIQIDPKDVESLNSKNNFTDNNNNYNNNQNNKY